MPSSNSSRARGSALDSHSSGKYFSDMRVTCSSMSHCTALATPGWRSTSRRVPQSPPPMIATLRGLAWVNRSEEHTSELQSLMRISYAVFCLKQTKILQHPTAQQNHHN